MALAGDDVTTRAAGIGLDMEVLNSPLIVVAKVNPGLIFRF